MNSELIALFQQTHAEIIARLSNAGDLLDDERAEREIRVLINTLQRLGVAAGNVLPLELLMQYEEGMQTAAWQLNSAGVPVEVGVTLEAQTAAAGVTAGAFQRQVHIEALEALIDGGMDDLQAAIRTAEIEAARDIRQTLNSVKADIAQGIIQGEHGRVARARVAKTLASNGLRSFKTIDGKWLPLDFYAATVARTKLNDANTQAAKNRYIENDVTLARIEGNVDTCAVCAKYQGQVISLTGEDEGYLSINNPDVRLPPYHPNCRDLLAPFVARLLPQKDIDAAKRKAESFDPEKDTRTKAQKAAYEKEQTLRRKANAEKKEYAKMKNLLGNDAPKSLGGFRSMKRSNSKNYRALKQRERELTRTVSPEQGAG